MGKARREWPIFRVTERVKLYKRQGMSSRQAWITSLAIERKPLPGGDLTANDTN